MKTGEFILRQVGRFYKQPLSISCRKFKVLITLTKKYAPFLLLLITITFHSFQGQAQNSFPRNENEALAMQLHDWYIESQKNLADWKAELIKAKNNSETAEDKSRINQINAQIKAEQEWCNKIQSYWERNRTLSSGTVKSFAAHYGSLSETSKPANDGKYDKIEAAIRNNPSNVTINCLQVSLIVRYGKLIFFICR